MGLKEFVALKIILTIPTIFILLTGVFFLIHIIPGDPVRSLVGPDAGEETVAELRHELGLDKPLLVQYTDYLSGILRGDLGRSVGTWSYQTLDVSSLILDRLPTTIQLSIIAWVISFLVGLVTGVFFAMNEGKKIDHLFQLFFLFLYSVPLFTIGVILQMIFGVYLKIFPVFGMFSEPFRMDPITGFSLLDNLIAGNFAGFLDALSYLVLPSLTLATYYSTLLSRLSRSEILQSSKRMYCLVAEAKGLKKRTIFFKHILRNAILPIFTLSGLQAVSMLTGSLLVETIFSINGLSSLLIFAATRRDYLLVQGCITVFTLIAVIIGLIIDIGYYFLDPRVRY